MGLQISTALLAFIVRAKITVENLVGFRSSAMKTTIVCDMILVSIQSAVSPKSLLKPDRTKALGDGTKLESGGGSCCKYAFGVFRLLS